MRSPKSPPSQKRLLAKLFEDPARMVEVYRHAQDSRDTQYLHWDELRYRQPPGDLTPEEWWIGIKMGRSVQAKELPLSDPKGRPFTFVRTDALLDGCRRVDQGASGRIASQEANLNDATRMRYVFDSLVDEAIHSSMIEGAVTTRRVAKEMIRTRRTPTDHSERMILNNYQAMELVRESANEPLSERLVLALHRTVTHDTLDDPADSGRLRRTDDVVIEDMQSGEVRHHPPPASTLRTRLQALCDFANGETPNGYMHPLVRAMLVHFWLAYDHPFVDGNGRTARALFFWVMLRNGYWLFEHLSVSRWINKSKVQYYRAFLHAESDERDTTYFLHYHLRAVLQALDGLHDYIEQKGREIRRLEQFTRHTGLLNHRQQALVAHALRHPSAEYTFRSHMNSHRVVYQTARTDLIDLEERGLLVRHQRGKTYIYQAADDLESALQALPES